MSAINSVLSSDLTLKTSDASNSKDPKKIHDAAMQFESLMIGQVFKTIHEEEGEGWLGTGDDASASSAMGMADEYFAQSIAKRGGLGLAQMISRQLEPSSEVSTEQLDNRRSSAFIGGQ